MDTNSPSRRAPRQARARTTVEAIVEATARVVGDAGLDRATTSRIARVAGVSVGSLYQYFPGKEALFSALIRRQAELDRARVDEAVASSRGRPLEERLVAVFDAGFEPVIERPRLFVFIFTYLPGLGLLPVAHELERDLAEAVRRIVEEHRDELRDVDLDLASIAAVGALRGALIALAHHRPEKLEEAHVVRDYLMEAVSAVVGRWRR